MRKSWVVILALVVGCGNDDKLKSEGGLPMCASAKDPLPPRWTQDGAAGDRRCAEDNKIEECDGSYWRMVTDCVAQGMLCSQAPKAYAASCRSRKARGEECVGVDQANCDTGLVCLNGVCELACSPSSEPTGCAGTEVCMPLQQEKAGYCRAIVQTGGPCESPLECGTAGDDCVPYGKLPENQGGNLMGICGPPCGTNELYAQAGCAASLVCGWNPAGYVVTQVSAAGQPVACNLSAPSPNQACDGSNGFYCLKMKTKDGYKDQCANANPICGRPIAAIGRWTDIPAPPFPASANCALQAKDNTSFCALGPGATAMPRCLMLDQDANVGICVATCNDGTLATDLSCGTGYTCYRPASDEEIVTATLQKTAAGTNVICTDAVNCNAGYECVSGFVNDAKVCALVHKMCKPGT